MSCSKGDSSELDVQVQLGDNGLVTVIAQADGALSYRFSFGQNAVFNNTTGRIEYNYPNKGTFTIGVWAFFDAQMSSYSYQTRDVEITNAQGNTVVQANDEYIDSSETATEYSGYSLVWNDEFNYEGAPSQYKWHLQYIPIFGGSWANDEEQHYTSRRENAYVSNGTLKIVAKRENYTYNGSTKEYTSARLNSKFDMQYGRIDVRAKMPSSGGTWPAIWTLGTNVDELGNFHGNTAGSVGWPTCGEIDIMEQNGWNKTDVQANFHWADTQTSEYGTYGEEKSISTLNISDLTENFHLYSLVWTPSRLKAYVDGKILAQISNNSNIPFDNPHYLILNIAMGGNLGGGIPESFNEDTMEVDYVRFYQ